MSASQSHFECRVIRIIAIAGMCYSLIILLTRAFNGGLSNISGFDWHYSEFWLQRLILAGLALLLIRSIWMMLYESMTDCLPAAVAVWILCQPEVIRATDHLRGFEVMPATASEE